MSQQADFSLEDLTAEIHSLHRAGLEIVRAGTTNALEVGRRLLAVQKSLEGTGVTFKDYCVKHFPYYKEDAINKYKRMAANRETLVRTDPFISDKIPDHINKADAYLAKEVRKLPGGAPRSKHARRTPRPSKRDTLNQINKSKAVSATVHNDEPTFDWYLIQAMKIARSRWNEPEQHHARDAAAKFLRGEITADQLPKYERQGPRPMQVNDAPSIVAAAA
jgi:hypothetical protein